MEYLREKGFGYDAGGYIVPIVTGACIYDLEKGDFDYPKKKWAMRLADWQKKTTFSPAPSAAASAPPSANFGHEMRRKRRSGRRVH